MPLSQAAADKVPFFKVPLIRKRRRRTWETGLEMDIGTVIGLAFGSILIAISIYLGGSVGSYFDLPSVFIVIGGSLCTLFIRFTLSDVINSFKVAAQAFAARDSSPEDIIQELVSLSNIARKEGLLRLEKVPVSDPFLKKAVMYCVDGYEPEFIQQVLEKEIEITVARHGLGQGIFAALGDAAPAFGMIGTLIGLVAMLGNMKEPSKIGPSMAVAILTTLYGALVAHLVALPIMDKLRRKSNDEELVKRLVVEGIVGLQKGLNPRVLEELLNTFLPPARRSNQE